MKDRQAEERPAGVPEEAKQAGEAQDRWSWVETSVWTERMLTEEVKGGKWFSLISILRKRRGGKGRGRGRDHNRWTKAYFAEQGLFSLVTAFDTASQSSKR